MRFAPPTTTAAIAMGAPDAMARLVEAVSDLIRDEHEQYHEGPIDQCDSRLCVMFFNVVARLTR